MHMYTSTTLPHKWNEKLIPFAETVKNLHVIVIVQLMSKESTKFVKDNKTYILKFGIKNKIYEINKCDYSTQQGG